MSNEHPIAPPPELVASLRNSAPHGIRDAGVTRELWLIHNAYAAGAEQQLKLDTERINKARQDGADQELNACCELLRSTGHFLAARDLSDSRRAKLLSLKEQALEQLRALDQHGALDCNTDTIRRALEQLP